MSNNLHVLVTGINGFVGQHLARELHNRNIKVSGTALEQANPDITNILEECIRCDLTDAESVKQITFSKYDAVIHLAALSSQGMSFDKPHTFISINSAMVINLFETALAQKPAKYPRFIMISSGAVYENNQDMPLTEQSAVTHGSPYAISKLLGEMLGNYYQKRGIESVVVRPFNHTGPGQGPGFLLPEMVKQLSEMGKNGTLTAGNLKTRRDYTDVRDVVRAYVDLATAKTLNNRLYTVCSGKSRSGEEIVAAIYQELYGETNMPNIQVDSSRIRPNDPPEIYGSHKNITTDINWEPAIPFDQTIRDYIAWYKQNPF